MKQCHELLKVTRAKQRTLLLSGDYYCRRNPKWEVSLSQFFNEYKLCAIKI